MKQRSLFAAASLGCAALTALACSAVTGSSQFTGDGGSGGAATGGGGSGGQSSASGMGGDDSFVDAGKTGSSSSGGLPSDCTEAAKLIYVVGTGNELYSFSPPTLNFNKIGLINCPQGGGFATPFSMAVDRGGAAWVLFSDGHLYKVDTATAACQATNFVPNQDPNFGTFGMGFVSDSVGSQEETLYIGSYTGTGIAKIDLQTMKVIPIGTYDKVSGPAEITGTGDARLYGFFLSSPVIVAEIDKTTSHILSQAPQPTVNIGGGWAFAFWGGDFYLFTAPNGFSSQVDKYSPASKSTTVVKSNVGFTIVGAGVSTCAPFEPPK